MNTLHLLVKNAQGRYLTADDQWSYLRSNAWKYHSNQAFGVAFDFPNDGVHVVLCLANGKEVPITEEEFGMGFPI